MHKSLYDNLNKIKHFDFAYSFLMKKQRALYLRHAVQCLFDVILVECLYCDREEYLLDDMLEHFGDYASIPPHSKKGETVVITAHVGINHRFYLWLMGYGDGIELLSPEKVRKGFLNEVRKMLGAYHEFSFQEQQNN